MTESDLNCARLEKLIEKYKSLGYVTEGARRLSPYGQALEELNRCLYDFVIRYEKPRKALKGQFDGII